VGERRWWTMRNSRDDCLYRDIDRDIDRDSDRDSSFNIALFNRSTENIQVFLKLGVNFCIFNSGHFDAFYK
jgi:hypothetical protein